MNVRPVADEQIAVNGDAQPFEGFDLPQQRGRVDDQSVADDGLFAPPQNAAGNQREHESPLAYLDGMPGVVTALAAHDDVKAFGEQIDDLALALVAPLQT